MHYADIIAALTKAAYSQTKIAADCGVTGQAVYQVIRSKNNSSPIARRISEVTGIPLKQIWPDGRYNQAA